MSKRLRSMPTPLQHAAYAAIRGVLGVIGAGDVDQIMDAARTLGRGYSRLEPARVRRTIDTLAVAFPDMPEEARHAYALRAYEHLFMLGVEMAYTPRLITPDAWSDRVRLGELSSAVQTLLEDRPCVMITGHCGNWELLGYTMALIGFPMHALYRPLDLKPLDRWVRSTRQRRGLMLLDKFGAAETMPELMRRRALVAFIADQNAGDRGLFVPFFGRLASTYKSIGLLALQFDAPIICGQARRLEPGFRYTLDAIDVIMPEDWRGRPDPLFYVSARYRRALEQMVRRAPEQNLWLHRYWKSRPRHEHTGKPFPPALRDKLRTLPWMTDDELARIEDWSARDARALADTPPKPARTVPATPAPDADPP